MAEVVRGSSSNSRTGTRPKFVKFAPGDRGEFLQPVFFEDPTKFTPKAGPKGQVHAWGLYPYVRDDPEVDEVYRRDPAEGNLPSFDGMAAMQRQMMYQTKYGFFSGGVTSPEDQFMQVLIERKKKQLKNLNLNSLNKRDVILKISLMGLKDSKGELRIWRRFRVSAGITLSTFQDKVLAPIMGWVRNFHCYTLTDFRDGAIFGPQESSSVDRVHTAQVGYEYLPDEKYMLAHLFSKVGDTIGYLYDFGDKWYHDIEVEVILPTESSDGRIEILDGKGMCPGENMQGNDKYSDFLKEYDAASYREKQEKKREILACPNYDSFGKPPSLFDIDRFDLAAAKERLGDALASTNSVASGAKKFHMPLAPQSVVDGFHNRDLKKGQTSLKTPSTDDYGYWNETTSNVHDKRRQTVCAACGKPGGSELKQCSGCKKILYCSAEHQKAHWKTSHKKKCTREFLPAKASK